MDKLDLKSDSIEKEIHINREQIYVLFRKKIENGEYFLNIKNMELLKKH